MMGWLDFFIIFYWLCLGMFFFNNATVLSLLIFAELTWLVLYAISILVGAYVNDLTAMSMTFFILGFGGLEFVVGMLLIILLKNFQISLSTSDQSTQNFSDPLNPGNNAARTWHI